jgi:hypothetical protein
MMERESMEKHEIPYYEQPTDMTISYLLSTLVVVLFVSYVK